MIHTYWENVADAIADVQVAANLINCSKIFPKTVFNIFPFFALINQARSLLFGNHQ